MHAHIRKTFDFSKGKRCTDPIVPLGWEWMNECIYTFESKQKEVTTNLKFKKKKVKKNYKLRMIKKAFGFQWRIKIMHAFQSACSTHYKLKIAT